MEPTISIIVPVLGRPHRVEPLLASIADATTVPHIVHFVVSANDRPMIHAITARSPDAPTYLNVTLDVLPPYPRGDYAKKINYAYAHSTAPYLFLAADDLHFHHGWDVAALEAMTDGIGVVGTQDLALTERAKRGEHATHSLVARAYVDRFGTIDEPGKVLHEGYWHEFVDDELVATAKHRGAWAFAHGSVVEHLHPSWGKAAKDRMYRQAGERMAHGRVLFAQRRRLWEVDTSEKEQVK